ncbi:MAG: hypothetical protein GY898_26490 [Proteobacteria bacterium]|nr:hypothetical protein [Pseudomonadota bacterium]
MTSHASHIVRSSLFTSALLFAACSPQGVIGPDGQLRGADDPAAGTGDDDHPAGPLNPDTLAASPEEHPCFESAQVLTEDRRELAFHYSCEAGPEELEPGKIVWGLVDGGYLRRIESVDVQGTSAYLTTEFASLAEAVTDVEFGEDVVFDEERRVIDFSGRVLDDVEVEGGRSTVTVNTGSLDMDPQINARGSFGFLRLKSVTSRNRIPVSVDMETHFHSDGPTDRAQVVEIESFSKPFTLKVGPVRVRGRLDSKVSIGFVHNSDGPVDVTSRFTGNGVIEMGGTYYMPSTWNPHWNPNFTGTVTELQPDGDSTWNGRVYLITEGQVYVDGEPGGDSRFEIGNTASSDSDCEAVTWNNSGGITGQTTMRLRVLGRNVNHDFPALDIEADSKTGTIEHDAPPVGCLDDDEYGVCEPVASISCGDAISGDTSGIEAVPAMDAYPCNVGNYDSAELVYEWVATSATAEFSLVDATPTELNHDLFVLDGGEGQCSAAQCVAHGFNSVEFDAVPGRTYYLVVDGFYEETGPFQARLDCN